MNIEMSPRNIFVMLLSVIGILFFSNIMAIVSIHVFGHPTPARRTKQIPASPSRWTT